MKAVIHVDEMEKWTMGVGNLKRLIAYCQDENQPFELELVANGDAAPGVTAETARELGLDEGLETVLAQGAVVCVCQGAMKGSGIAPEQLMAGVKIVPSGVCELVLRQQEGYAYVRP